MRIAWLLLVAAFPAFADLDSCVAETDRLRVAGQLTPVQKAERVRDCNNAFGVRTPITDEYWAYHIYLASEFQAGRITQEQAQYLSAQKQAELSQREASMLAPLLPYAAPRPNPYRSFRQPAPSLTRCYREGDGVTCVNQ